jgi:chromosome segregation ATPase
MPVLDTLNVINSTPTTSSYIEWILGGGATSLAGAFFGYHMKFVEPRIKEVLGKVSSVVGKTSEYDSQIDKLKGKFKRDTEGFASFQLEYLDFKAHTEEAIKRVDNAESRIDDFIVEIKASNSSLIARFGDMQTGINLQEGRISKLEGSERRHYEELKEMSSDTRIMEKEIQYLRNDMSDMKDLIKQMTSSITELKDLIITTTMKPK